MALGQYLYLLYLHCLALPMVLALMLLAWKKEKIQSNARICGKIADRRFVFRFYLALVLDFLRFAHGHYGQAIHLQDRDTQKLQKLKSTGSIFLTAHFHNWELMGAWLTQNGIPLLSGARPMANALSQSLLVRLRSRLNMKVVFTSLPRQGLRHLRNQGCFAMLWDQRVSNPGTSAAFFGRSLALDPLPLFLLRHQPVPVYFGVLLPTGQLRLIQLAHPDPDRGKDPFQHLGRRYHRTLEILVRNYPAYWYGLAHGRFQNAPREEPMFHVKQPSP